MRNYTQKDNKPIEYCLNKLAIEKPNKHALLTTSNDRYAYSVIIILLFLTLISEIAKAF